jgi:hypothetical protein
VPILKVHETLKNLNFFYHYFLVFTSTWAFSLEVTAFKMGINKWAVYETFNFLSKDKANFCSSECSRISVK